MVRKEVLALSVILISIVFVALAVNAAGGSTGTNENNDSGNNETNECTTEQDCISSGKCSAGLECTCASNNKCYAGLIATCTKDRDCPSGQECEDGSCVLDDDDEDENETDDDSDDNETEIKDDCEWRCTKWSMCENGTASRTCQNANNCTTETPRLSKSCFERDKVCCKITETEFDEDDNETKTEYEYEDRTSCLETDEDGEGETKSIVANGLCMADIRERCAYDGLKERIKCRLENHNRFENFSDSDESCEGLRNKGLCVALYVISQHCYKIEDGEKRDRCFKMVSEFREIHVGSEVNKSKLTSEQGATLIEKIVEIKQSILNGESKESIKSQIRELKNLWKTYKADEGENDE